MEKSRPPAAAVAAPITRNLFIEQTRYASLGQSSKKYRGPRAAPHTFVPDLWDQHRRQRRDAADILRARELRQIEGGNQGLVTLIRCRLTGQRGRALAGEGVDVLVGADTRV